MLIGKVNEFHQSMRTGNWEAVCLELIKSGLATGKLVMKPDCQVAEAQWNDEEWSLTTTKGAFKSTRLLVAQTRGRLFGGWTRNIGQVSS